MDEVLVNCEVDDVLNETDPLMIPNLPFGVYPHETSGSFSGQMAR